MKKILLLILLVCPFFTQAQTHFSFPNGETVPLKGDVVSTGTFAQWAHKVYVYFNEQNLVITQTKLLPENSHKLSTVEIQKIAYQDINTDIDTKKDISENKGKFFVSVSGKGAKALWQEETIKSDGKENDTFITVEIKFDTKQQAKQFIKTLQLKCKK